MIGSYFSVPIWKESCGMDFSTEIDLYNQIINDCKKNPNQMYDKWNCDVHSSFLPNKPDNIDYTKSMFFYKKAYESFANSLGMKRHSYKITDIWYNKYKQKQFQEIHHHHPSSFSAIHYLRLCDDHPGTTFINPSKHGFLYESFLTNLFNLCDSSNDLHSFFYPKFSISVKQGDIIIFPSSIEHEVCQQKSNNERITISFNIQIDS